MKMSSKQSSTVDTRAELAELVKRRSEIAVRMCLKLFYMIILNVSALIGPNKIVFGSKHIDLFIPAKPEVEFFILIFMNYFILRELVIILCECGVITV